MQEPRKYKPANLDISLVAIYGFEWYAQMVGSVGHAAPGPHEFIECNYAMDTGSGNFARLGNDHREPTSEESLERLDLIDVAPMFLPRRFEDHVVTCEPRCSTWTIPDS